MEAELTEELGYEKHDPREKETTNRRNGKTAKRLRTDQGPMDIVPLIVLAFLICYYFKSAEFTPLQRWAVAGILGGGIGNLADRIFRPDGVVDFISVNFYGFLGFSRWPTFNLADSGVVVCGIILLISVGPQRPKKRAPMGRKINTILFILGATAFNILVTLLAFGGFLFLYYRLLLPRLPQDSIFLGLPVIFVCSVVLSFFVYRWALKRFLKHFDTEKYLAPLFESRSKSDSS
ncbi:hypothetical protein FACS189468_7570 [Spirochaetia bacterium]|nr:hypothetical protein FACS189468_7570 [Spirochaetia bacterium]